MPFLLPKQRYQSSENPLVAASWHFQHKQATPWMLAAAWDRPVRRHLSCRPLADQHLAIEQPSR